MYDVIVVGAGPAGATAAALLAKQERGVLLVEADSLPRSRTQTVWVSAQAVPLIEAVGAKPAKVLGKPFADVTFYDAELAKSAKPDPAEATGYLVDRSTFDHALVKAAVARKSAAGPD